jgi:hypothetical protein
LIRFIKKKLVRQIEKGGVELQWLSGEDVWWSFEKSFKQ